MMQRIRQRGFTMMEAVLVIATGLGLLVGGIVFYEQAQVNRVHLEAVRSVVSIASDVRHIYRDQPSISHLSEAQVTSTVQQYSSLPQQLLSRVRIRPIPDEPQFAIWYQNLYWKTCDRIAFTGFDETYDEETGSQIRSDFGPKIHEVHCWSNGTDIVHLVAVYWF